MNNNSEMTRWTLPTNTGFFALHKGAIGLYGTVTLIVQSIWLLFSIHPFADLLRANFPTIGDYSLIIAGVVLLGLHYVLHELLRYVFYNLLDDDPNTVNGLMHYAVVAIIIVGMFLLDLQGTTRFFDKSDALKSELSETDATTRNDLDKLAIRQNAELERIKATHDNEVKAIADLYAPKLKSIKNRRTWDAADVRKRDADYDRKMAEMNAAIATKTTDYAVLERTTLADHTKERRRINAKADTSTVEIKGAIANTVKSANNYGWAVSLICLLALLGCMYQMIVLRIGAGQKPVSRFTIADATGSTSAKFFDVVSDIYQRKTHAWLAAWHAWATTNTRELDTLDGAFKLKGGKYEIINRNNNGASGDDNSGGGNGGNPTPPNSPKGGGGNTKTQVAQTDVDVMVIPSDRAIEDAMHDLGSAANSDEILKLAAEYDKPRNTPESVITSDKSVITTDKAENDLITDGIRKQIQSVNSECSHYENNHGDRHRIAQRIGAKTNTLRELVIQHKDEIPDSVFENFQKAHARAKAILLAHKEGSNE